jgi:hypothetical protein
VVESHTLVVSLPAPIGQNSFFWWLRLRQRAGRKILAHEFGFRQIQAGATNHQNDTILILRYQQVTIAARVYYVAHPAKITF